MEFLKYFDPRPFWQLIVAYAVFQIAFLFIWSSLLHQFTKLKYKNSESINIYNSQEYTPMQPEKYPLKFRFVIVEHEEKDDQVILTEKFFTLFGNQIIFSYDETGNQIFYTSKEFVNRTAIAFIMPGILAIIIIVLLSCINVFTFGLFFDYDLLKQYYYEYAFNLYIKSLYSSFMVSQFIGCFEELVHQRGKRERGKFS